MFRLRILAGPRAGEALSLAAGKTYVVGRAREADFRFPEDATMSRAHAEIAPDPAGGWIMRNKSQHGTLVGAAKIDADKKLTAGDVLTIGGTQVVYEADTGGSADMATRPPVAAALPANGNEPKTPPPLPRSIAGAAPAGATAGAAGATPAAAAGATPAGTPPVGGKPGDPAAAAAAALKKGGNKNLIIGLVVVFFLLFCCCPGSWFGFNWIRAYRLAHASGG